jgi:beta-barrel assembly-enhancing protease
VVTLVDKVLRKKPEIGVMKKVFRFLLVVLMACSLVLSYGYWVATQAAMNGSHAQAHTPAKGTGYTKAEPPVPSEPTPAPEAEGDPEAGVEPEAAVEPEVEAEAEPTQEEWFQRELLIAADDLYLAGDIDGATDLYREAKTKGWLEPEDLEAAIVEPFTDEALLSPGAAVYWRESARGVEAGRESQALIPLGLLTQDHPAFIPGHLRYAELLMGYDKTDEAQAVFERALTAYPSHPDLLKAQIELMTKQEQWIEASISARQFELLNPEHPEAAAYGTIADESLERFKSVTNAQIREGAIANVFTGVAGFLLTGGIYGPFTALSSTMVLLQGEEAIGAQVAEQVRDELPMLEDEEVVAYVNRVGQKLAAVAGRDDFEYEFGVILDPELNAFALPGGKVFVNAGAILDTKSEAELAGLLAHELSHTVLSHGFQMVVKGNLTASLTQYLPLPGLITNALVTGYSRQMERQADIVGTQLLAASDYAADGMYGLMLALNNRYGDRQQIAPWLSSHPAPQERVDYVQALIERGGYNRYTYEGVASHEGVQALTRQALEKYKQEQEEKQAEEEAGDVDEAVEEVQQERETVPSTPGSVPAQG